LCYPSSACATSKWNFFPKKKFFDRLMQWQIPFVAFANPSRELGFSAGDNTELQTPRI